MTRTVLKALALVALATLMPAPSRANEFTRIDVLALVNRDARNWILDADNFRLDIEMLRIPRAAGEQGKVCGRIVSLRSRPDPRAFRSYTATLWIENSRLVVGGLTPFLMGIEDLVASDLCQ